MMEDKAIREEVAKLVPMLETGLSELNKTVIGIRELIQTIDSVIFRLEVADYQSPNIDIVDDHSCTRKEPMDGAGECFYRWLNEDINDNVVMTEEHWQAYASQDWFAGFKNFPRCQKTKCFGSLDTGDCRPPTFCMQVADVLLQIEKILYSLETKTLPEIDTSDLVLPSDISFSEFFTESIEPPNESFCSPCHDDGNYYLLSADVMGDYEEKVDNVLDNISSIAVSSSEDDGTSLHKEKISAVNFQVFQPKENPPDKVIDNTEQQLECFFD